MLITNALLGSPEFFAFGWRNHAGLWADSQHHWWHGFAADGFGAEAKDGGIALNFGRLNDPVINDLLDEARGETDPDARKAIAQDINRQFAKSAGSCRRRGRRGASSWTRRSRTSAATRCPTVRPTSSTAPASPVRSG